MDDGFAETNSSEAESERISSESLAALIVDALINVGIIAEERSELSIAIATEEINVRKALGDY